MTNPVLVEVTRGGMVESRHRGAIAVVDAHGRRRFAIGDVEAATFPRSAVKLLQALPLVESGAADHFGFGNAELALACSSHNGEPRHVQVASSMLEKAGRSELDLECGPQAPSWRSAADALVRSGLPALPIHNNCSGKHAGFICTACYLGIDPRGYVGVDHPIQREIAAVMGALTGLELTGENCGIDGCAIPTWPMPLERQARAFARLATGEGLEAMRARAARRLMDACFAEPSLVAGSGRFDSEVMALLPGRVFIKGGAEGVCTAAFPHLGLGVALKSDDGATRAAEAMMAAVVLSLVALDDRERGVLEALAVSDITNRRGAPVGTVRPSASFIEALAA